MSEADGLSTKGEIGDADAMSTGGELWGFKALLKHVIFVFKALTRSALSNITLRQA